MSRGGGYTGRTMIRGDLTKPGLQRPVSKPKTDDPLNSVAEMPTVKQSKAPKTDDHSKLAAEMPVVKQSQLKVPKSVVRHPNESSEMPTAKQSKSVTQLSSESTEDDISEEDSINSEDNQKVIPDFSKFGKDINEINQMNKGKGLQSFTKSSGDSTLDEATNNLSPPRAAKGNGTNLKDRPIEAPLHENKPTTRGTMSGRGRGGSNVFKPTSRPIPEEPTMNKGSPPAADFHQFESSPISEKPATSEKREPCNFGHLGTGSNAVPVGRDNYPNHPKGRYQDNEVDDEDKAKIENARNATFRKPKEDRPRGFVPRNRTVDALYEEDGQNRDLYANAFEADEEIEVTGLNSPPACIDNWTDTALHKTVLQNIDDCNYVRPRKIQSYVIPLVLEGRDFKAQAETGSGKSGSFLIPIISKIAEENDEVPRLKKENFCPRAIIVAPTRELVSQLSEQASKIARDTKVQVKFCYGEYNFCENSYEIVKGTDVLVATPGRLVHFMTSSIVGISRLKYLVFDEADKLFDESFTKDFDQMVNIPGFPSKDQIQVMLFSATYPESNANWLESLLKSKHVVVKNFRANEPNLRIHQSFEECSANNKTMRLLEYCQQLINEYQKARGSDKEFPRILAFVRRCDTADAYTFYLNQNDITTLSLNSKRGQKSREKSLSMFRQKKVTMIIATDVCSRGLDIKDLDYVINIDLPEEFSTYVQRIGRTGRLQHGFSHSFVDMMNDQDIVSELVESLKAESQAVPEFMTGGQKPLPGFNMQPVEPTCMGFD